RLPDPGIAADEHDGALDEAAPEHAVELAHARRAPERLARRHRDERTRHVARRTRRTLAPRTRSGGDLLGERVPRLAPGTLPEPARRRVAALLADEDGAMRLVNHDR